MDWSQRINEAESVGGFDLAARDYARCWATCAVGELPNSVGVKRGYGMPADLPLCSMGAEFANAVFSNDFERARKTRAAIQERAAELIAERYAGGAL